MRTCLINGAEETIPPFIEKIDTIIGLWLIKYIKSFLTLSGKSR